MKNLWKKPAKPPQTPPDNNTIERRVGRIVRDERGMAMVEWVEAPPGYEPAPLAIADTAPVGAAKARSAPAPDAGANPYERTLGSREPSGTAIRRDLRKLSEWIKLMRELEEQKRREEEEKNQDR